jgi:hypothetical protein
LRKKRVAGQNGGFRVAVFYEEMTMTPDEIHTERYRFIARRAVITPAGPFESETIAAVHFHINKSTVGRRCKAQQKDWRFADEAPRPSFYGVRAAR